MLSIMRKLYKNAFVVFIYYNYTNCDISSPYFLNRQNRFTGSCDCVFPACDFIEKETPTQVLSCEFCEIFKNTKFTEHIWVTASQAKRFYETTTKHETDNASFVSV